MTKSLPPSDLSLFQSVNVKMVTAIAVFIGVIAIVVFLILRYAMLGPAPSFRDYEAVRQAALDGLKEGFEGGERFNLRAVPSLATAKNYPLGSVFIANTYPLRHTSACLFDKVNPKEKLPQLPSWSRGYEFSLNAKLPTVLQQAIAEVSELAATVAIAQTAVLSFEMGMGQTVDVQDAYDQLLVPECLAAIANQPVWVLVGIYEMKETYSRKVGDKADLKVVLLDEADLSVRFNIQGDFSVTQNSMSPRAWGFIAFQQNVPGFDFTAPSASRLAAAEEFLGQLETTAEQSSFVTPSLNPAFLDFIQ